MIYFFLFLFGLGTGSFLNVLIFRYRPERFFLSNKIIGGRSRCRTCQKTLHWRELIPLFSFLFQRRRCRGCKSFISWQYPLVEFLSGLIFLIIPFYFSQIYRFSILSSAGNYFGGYYVETALWIFAFLIFLLIAFIDYRRQLIPDELNFFLLVLGTFLIGLRAFFNDFYSSFPTSFLKNYATIFRFSENIWLNHFMGALIGAGIFWLIIVLSRGRGMGWGDLKLGLAGGWLFGWPDIGLATMLSFMIGGLFGGLLLVFKIKTWKDALPFGPFIILGFALTFFFGYRIIDGYFRLFNLI